MQNQQAPTQLHPNAEQMHQFSQLYHQQYNQQTNLANEPNLPPHQMPQQHQMDIPIHQHQDNDPHYHQYKLYVLQKRFSVFSLLLISFHLNRK